jgi:hypothetical protein
MKTENEGMYCPRCGGMLYWMYHYLTRLERNLYKDKVKCFACARIFHPVKENGSYVWRRWPEKVE